MRACNIVISLFCFVLISVAQGAIKGQNTLTINFKDSNDAISKSTWSEPDKVGLTAEGLGWDGKANESRDFWLRTSELAIGLWWRPTDSANVSVEIEPCKETIKLDNGQTYQPSAGFMFVRYSPDKLNWSSWQAMQYERDKDKSQQKYEYSCFVSIPHSSRQEYLEYMRKYIKMDVPWQSDEEAMVKWILESDPNFFERSIPFIGYLQFLYDTGLHGGHRIARFSATANWGVGGMHSPPKDESIYKDKDAAWRFQASQSSVNIENSIDVRVEGEHWNVKADLSEDVIAERDKLMAEADAKIRSGLVLLSDEFTNLKKARDWEEEISEVSDEGQIRIWLRHSHKGKGKTTKTVVPENEQFSVLVMVLPPPEKVWAMSLFPQYSNLGLVGQVNAMAGDAELERELKKLVDEALEPLERLDESLDDKKPDMQVAKEKYSDINKNSIEEIIKSWGRQKEFFFKGGFKIIGWEEAKKKLLENKYSGGKQYHTGWLTIYCLDGSRFLTKQPELDAYIKFMGKYELSTKEFGAE